MLSLGFIISFLHFVHLTLFILRNEKTDSVVNTRDTTVRILWAVLNANI